MFTRQAISERTVKQVNVAMELCNFKMFNLLYCVCFVLMVTDGAQCGLIHLPLVPDGMTVHNVIATWAEARDQCQSEGAILASPTNGKLLNTMQSLIGITNATYYIGTRASDRPGHFVSLDGVPLEHMNVSLWQQLDPWNGDCLAMTVDRLHVVSCETRLPYICYDAIIDTLSVVDVVANMTNCSTGYTYDLRSKHCYKVHTEYLTWEQAQMTCVAEGGNLFVVDNGIETQIISSIYHYGPASWVWTGIRDYTGKGDWITVHGQRVDAVYNVWKDINHAGDACAIYYLSGHLHPKSCAIKYDFICEKMPTF